MESEKFKENIKSILADSAWNGLEAYQVDKNVVKLSKLSCYLFTQMSMLKNNEDPSISEHINEVLERATEIIKPL